MKATPSFSWLLPLAVLGLFSMASPERAHALSSEQLSGIRAKLRDSRKPRAAAASKPVVSPSIAKRIEIANISARNLLGRIYDQTMGSDGGKNYAAGQIVCVDVPRLALADAGVSMADILLADARLHPGRYPREKSGDNVPDHPIFARRTRNWVRWCKENGRFLPPTATPRPGDVVFYGTMHIAYVYEVDPDGHYKIVETAPTTRKCLEQYDWMMDLRGWKATGFGRILPLPATYAHLMKPAQAVVAMAPDPQHTIEKQIDSHPGMGMMAGIFSRLQGKPLPKALTGTAANARSLTLKAAALGKAGKGRIAGRSQIAINFPAAKMQVSKTGASLAAQDVPAEQKAYLLAGDDKSTARSGTNRERQLWAAAANAPAVDSKARKAKASPSKKPAKSAAKSKSKPKTKPAAKAKAPTNPSKSVRMAASPASDKQATLAHPASPRRPASSKQPPATLD